MGGDLLPYLFKTNPAGGIVQEVKPMNSIGKRIGGVLILILAALVLLASVGGVVGLWAVNGEAHDLADAVFAPVENGLTTANKALDKVNTRVTNARTRVNSAQDFVSQLGTNL